MLSSRVGRAALLRYAAVPLGFPDDDPQPIPLGPPPRVAVTVESQGQQNANSQRPQTMLRHGAPRTNLIDVNPPVQNGAPAAALLMVPPYRADMFADFTGPNNGLENDLCYFHRE